MTRPNPFAAVSWSTPGLLAVMLALVFSGCRKRTYNNQGGSGVRSEGSSAAEAPASGTGAIGRLPAPGGKMYVPSEAEKQAIIDAMKQVKRAFYDTTEGYDDPKPSAPPDFVTEGTETRKVSPDRWSDLMTHYYAHYPTYTPKVFPNIRECFSRILQQMTVRGIGKRITYPEAYDFCVFMPMDRREFKPDGERWNWGNPTKEIPPFDESARAIRPLQGPLAWVHTHQEEAFKFIMFAGPCSVDPEAQQEILNRFYGVDLKGKNTYTASDVDQSAECQNKRPPWLGKDPFSGTHCSFDLRRRMPLAENCYVGSPGVGSAAPVPTATP